MAANTPVIKETFNAMVKGDSRPLVVISAHGRPLIMVTAPFLQPTESRIGFIRNSKISFWKNAAAITVITMARTDFSSRSRSSRR